MPTGSEEYWEERSFTEAVRLLVANTRLSHDDAERELASAYRSSTVEPPRKALSTAVDELLAAYPKPPTSREPFLRRIRRAFARGGATD
jgi:hypothetical protein